MKRRLRSLSLLSIGSLLLSGCASIIAFPQPSGFCDGSPVSISVSPNNPISDGGFNEEIQETEITLQVEGDLSDIDIEYSLGIYNETGLNSVDDSYLSESAPPRPNAEEESFMQFAYGLETDLALTLAEDMFTQVSPGRYEVTGTFVEILLSSEIPEIINSMEAGAAILLLPGAFLAKCTASGSAQENQYVAADALFPNLAVFDGDDYPVLSVSGEVIDFSVPVEYEGSQMYLIAQVRDSDDEPWSEEPATDRWLQVFTITEDDILSGNVVQAQGTVGAGGSLDSLAFVEAGRFQPGETYNIIMLFITENFYAFRSAIFDAVIDESGEATFIPFEGEFIPVDSPRRGGYRAPTITDNRTVIKVSTKGNREVQIEGTALAKVTSANIESKVAKIVSSQEAEIVLQLPKMKPGLYGLSLVHNRGELVKERFVNYVRSRMLTKLTLPRSLSNVSAIDLLSKGLEKHVDTVQVDCVARIPAGTKLAPLKKKASAICASVSDSSIITRVVVKKVSPGASPAVAVKLWD